MQTLISATWNEILDDMQKARKIKDECRHDDSSLRSRRLEEEAGIKGYFLGKDSNNLPAIVLWGDRGEMTPVIVEDPESIELHINVYHTQRCYGGPEEGGWYYDAHECLSTSRVFWDPEYDQVSVWVYFQRQLDKHIKRFNNEGSYPLSSVLSNGQWDVMLEVFPKESETTERPTYC